MKLLLSVLLSVSSLLAAADNIYTIPYGSPITLETAKKAVQAAQAEAKKNNWFMVVAVVDPSGNLVCYEKMDNALYASTKVSINKARSAALYKRPTKVFEESLKAGGENLRVFSLEGAVASQGGIPILQDGKIIGAIGVSGDASSNDHQCALKAIEALKETSKQP